MSSTADPNAPLSGAAATLDRGALTAVLWVCFAVASSFLALRLAVRWRQNGRFLPDDYWITWGWACFLTMTILQTLQMPSLWYLVYVAAGRIGYDPDEVTAANVELVRWQYPIITLFWIVTWSVKASFLSIFYRLVKQLPLLRRLWYFVVAFTVMALIANILTSTFTCSPPSSYFAGDCSTPRELWRQHFNVIFSTAVDVASDVMIMSLPLLALPSMQLDKRKKVGLAVIFGISTIIVIVAVVRMTQVIVGSQVDLVGLAVWGDVESAVAITVGSLPPLKSLITRRVRMYQSSRKSGSKRYAEGGAGTVEGSSSRAAVISESIPLDDMHTSGQSDGGIYAKKTFTAALEQDSSSNGDSDEAEIIQKAYAR